MLFLLPLAHIVSLCHLFDVRPCYYLIESFSHQRQLMVFHWRLSDSKFPQVSRTLLGILANLNNDVVWAFSSRPVISKFCSPCTDSLVTVPRVPIIISIKVIFMFQSFFQYPSKVQILIHHFAFFQFYSVVRWDSKVHDFASSLFFVGRLAEIRWSIHISKSLRNLCVSFSGTDSGLCIYHLFVCSNLNFLHNSV